MAGITSIKKGSVLRHKNDLYKVTDFNFVNPGKGSSFVRVNMRNLTTGHTSKKTFKSGDDIELVDVYRKNMQYLYKEDEMYAFMDQENYDTIEVNEKIVGEKAKYLKEGLEIIMTTHEGSPVTMDLPDQITYKIDHAPPGVKGDSESGNVTKKVTLENGLKVDVPVFIDEDDEIVVNTNTGEYTEKA